MPYPSNTVIAAMTPYMSNLGAAVYRPQDNAPASNRSAATSGSDDQPDTTTYGGRHAPRICGQHRVTTITQPATSETTASTRRAVRKVSTSRADHHAASSASGGVSGRRYRVRWFASGAI